MISLPKNWQNLCKVSHQLSRARHYLIDLFKSTLSVALLAKHSNAESYSRICNSILPNSQILIVGSGPSLSNLTSDHIDKHDYIFFLNRSIKVTNHTPRSKTFFFSCDILAASKLKDDILKRGVKSIIVSQQIQYPGLISKMLADNNCVFVAPKVSISWKRDLFLPLPFLSVCMIPDNTIDTQSLPLSLSSGKKVPLQQHSSVFTLLDILLSRDPSKVTMIGFDFGSSYSNLIGSAEVKTQFSPNILFLWHNYINFIKSKSILLSLH